MFIYLESIGCPNDSLPFPVSQMVVIPLSVAGGRTNGTITGFVGCRRRQPPPSCVPEAAHSGWLNACRSRTSLDRVILRIRKKACDFAAHKPSDRDDPSLNQGRKECLTRFFRKRR
jgi:hypothetical protein